MSLKAIPCPGCWKPLTMMGCLTRGCMYGPHTGYTVPPPPALKEQPDPFPDPVKCPVCGQEMPRP